MSIIIRKNKHTARIMRQEYVRKDSEGNPHGFVRQVPLATISLAAIEVPAEISDILSTKELEHLQRVVVEPAQQEAQRQQRYLELRERDPNWRAFEALRWLEEVEAKSQNISLEPKVRKQLQEVIQRLGLTSADMSSQDPLDTVIKAVQHAVTRVEQGCYGKNEGVVRKDSLAARKWAQLRGLVLDDKNSLLVALQRKGWVSRRGVGLKN